jgi:hypothetical protein
VSDAVVRALSDATGRPAANLEGVGSAVDPIVLDALFRCRCQVSVSFELAGHGVTVGSEGTITVQPEPPVPAASTDAAFATALERLVAEASANGVAVEGGGGGTAGLTQPSGPWR